MALFLRELSRNFKSFIIWTLILIISNIGLMMMYPMIAEQAGEYNELMKKLPKEMLKGLSMDKLNFAQILDFFAYVFLYIILFGCVYAILLATSIISKEESEKTVEFLMAKPVTRNTIVTAKTLCVFFYITVFNVVFTVADYLAFEALKKSGYDINIFLLMHLGFFLIMITFAAIGLLVSVFIVKAKSIYPVAFGIVLGAFFINITAAISDKLENLKYLTPFKYINPSDIVSSGRIEGVYIIIMAAVTLVSVALTYVFYNRKDICV
ncbi:MAG TPA: ABC transporter permease subunit [Clostridiaceae bacterium]|nr:ABC transporter permease subunit [Clostridiaceae bacterium]